MATPLDLNDFLGPLITNGSLADLQGLLDLSLRPRRIIAEIARTKRYGVLPLFLPILHSKEDGISKDLARLMAQAMIDGDVEGTAFLRERLQGNLTTSEDIAFACGQIATSLPDKCGLSYTYRHCGNEFSKGLISVDNLDLFLRHRGRESLPRCFFLFVGQYGAKRIMNHFGYQISSVKMYLRGSFQKQNQDTISHLFEQVEDKTWLRKEIKHRTFKQYIDNIAPLVSWLLGEGYLQFTKEDWDELDKTCPVLYKALQADV